MTAQGAALTVLSSEVERIQREFGARPSKNRSKDGGCRPKDIKDFVGSSPGLSLLYHDPEPKSQYDSPMKLKNQMLEASWVREE